MMVSISCLVFTIQLVVALAVFDKNEIISKLANSNLLTWNIKENSSKVCRLRILKMIEKICTSKIYTLYSIIFILILQLQVLL